MIYGYIRVSSDKQTVENQRFEINKFCKNERLNVDDWIEETISGTKNFSKRQLGLLWINIGVLRMVLTHPITFHRIIQAVGTESGG